MYFTAFLDLSLFIFSLDLISSYAGGGNKVCSKGNNTSSFTLITDIEQDITEFLTFQF